MLLHLLSIKESTLERLLMKICSLSGNWEFSTILSSVLKGGHAVTLVLKVLIVA